MNEIDHKPEASHRRVRIHIDRQQYESPDPTTGAALYLLGHILTGCELFRETEGDREDKPVANDGTEIHIREDEHFYTQQSGKGDPETVTIVVEGTPHPWPKDEPITYVQVVTLEVPGYTPQAGITYSVTYKKGPANKPEGVLVSGAFVEVKDGMIFNVSETGQS